MTNSIETASYWETRYSSGGTSGAGSYGHLALYKAKFLNQFVASNRIQSVAELGCGDGAQLRRAVYPRYVGYDVSQSAVSRCAELFEEDDTKSFFWLEKVNTLSEVDLGLSIDVIYHLLEDETYEEHLGQLFRMSSRFAIIYGNEVVKSYDAQHIKLRNFRETVSRRYPAWRLVDAQKNPFYSEVGTDPAKTWSNFYVYQAPHRSWHPVVAYGNDCSAVSADGPGPRVRMSGDEFRDTSIRVWREIVRAASRGTAVVVPREELGSDPALYPPVASGYVSEIVRDTRHDHDGAHQMWIGVLRTEPDLLVSMTTIRSRLPHLDKVVASILGQSRNPDRVIINISQEPYLKDEGISRQDLTPFVTRMEEAGLLEIKSVPNTGPYRKLLPTLRSEWNSNCVIVTADDDTLYPPFWLDEFFQAYLTHRSIIARRCKYMTTMGGIPLPYNKWTADVRGDLVKPECNGVFVFATGKDGILYHPEFFTEDVFDPELINLAPTCDDLVFKLATMITATPVRAIPRKLSSSGRFEFDEYPTVAPATDTLWSTNEKGVNDASLAKLLAYMEARMNFSLRSFLQ